MHKAVFAKHLTAIWLQIPLEKSKLRNESPVFELDIKSINKEVSLIVIKIPSAIEELEALYMGVAYDKNYNVRYFTYEIAKGIESQTQYALCEWTLVWDHINHGFHTDNNMATFTNNIEAVYTNAV